jgi:hypothetical protein
MNNLSISLDNFDNADPHILTIFVIGTEDNVKTYLLRQDSLGMIEAGAWSRPIPVPNCPDKVICALNRTMI